MTTPRPQEPQKPFESTTAKLFKAFAADNLSLEQMKKIFSSQEKIDVAPAIAAQAAKAGQIRSATRNPNASLKNLCNSMDAMMQALVSPPETGTKLTAAMRESLKGIYDQNNTLAMAIRSDLNKIEDMRENILKGITRQSISPDDIAKLEKETNKYFTEIDALEKKVKPFLIKIDLLTSNIAPGLQGPKEQKTLSN